MKQLLDVMAVMHAEDIIHRYEGHRPIMLYNKVRSDIKCSNLLMTRDHILKVADFGLSRSIIGDQTFTNKVRITLFLIFSIFYSLSENIHIRYHTYHDELSIGRHALVPSS
jgi:serine/threonine protein kinase